MLRISMRRQRWRTLGWTAFFVLMVAGVVSSYKQAYPDLASRVKLAQSIAGNATFRMIYGEDRGLETVGGFIAWRLGAMTVFTGVWGFLTATALLRGEEEEGRWESMAAGSVGRARLTVTTLLAMAVHLTFMWALMVVSLVAQGLAATPTLFYATAFMLPGAYYAALGALVAQLAATRRSAAAICGTILGASFLLKVIGDGTRTFSWMRWLTPNGWYEMSHSYTGSSFVGIAPYVVVGGLMVVVAALISSRRDITSGVLFKETRKSSHRFLLGSVWGAALRQTRWNLTAWFVAVAAFAYVIGLLSRDVIDFLLNQEGIRRLVGAFVSLDKIINTYVGFMFVFVVLPVALFAALQLAPIREEESSGRLDVLTAQPLGRRRWILERLALAATGSLTIALLAGIFMWAGARTNGVSVDLVRALGAAINSLPAAVLFLGVGVLAFGFAPRSTSGVAVGTVLGAYVWYLVATVANWPALALDLTPFHHVAPYPAEPVNWGAAVVMAVAGAVMCAVGIEVFARRDLQGE